MRILFLSRWFPYPPGNGSKLRIYNLLRGLGAQHDITLLSFTEAADDEPDIAGLQESCRAVHTVQWKPFDPHGWRARLGMFSVKPRSVVDTFSPEMARRIETILATESIALIIASQIDMAMYSPYFQGIPAIFEELEVGVLVEQFTRATSLLTRLRYGLTWAKHRRYVRTLLHRFAACTVVSNQERQLLIKTVGDICPITVIPNGVDLASYGTVHEKPHPNTLIFIGAFSYSPNYQAMVWFLGEVLPLIQTQIPDAHLTITGHHGHRPLPAAKNVTLTGFVDDIRPLVARSWASIVPLHTGGGTRLKILEAMALKTPVVATSKGAEGIGAHAEADLLIADEPQAFAETVIRLLTDGKLREQLASNAFCLVQKKYDWGVILPRYFDLIERIGHHHDTD